VFFFSWDLHFRNKRSLSLSPWLSLLNIGYLEGKENILERLTINLLGPYQIRAFKNNGLNPISPGPNIVMGLLGSSK
jgi:hypothetical protein